MAYYSVLDVNPTTDSWVGAYVAETGKIVTKHGDIDFFDSLSKIMTVKK